MVGPGQPREDGWWQQGGVNGKIVRIEEVVRCKVEERRVVGARNKMVNEQDGVIGKREKDKHSKT